MEPQRDKRYTYADYEAWHDGNRYELIDGMIHMLSSPSVDHQAICFELSRQLGNHLRGKTCKAFAAPFDVRLNADTSDDTVVQPDISVICDPEKIKNGKCCMGAPDMVIEILSPSSGGYDQIIKYNKYLQAGVTEYWIVYPQPRSVMVYLKGDGGYFSQTYGEKDIVPVTTLEGCHIHLAEVFSTVPDEESEIR